MAVSEEFESQWLECQEKFGKNIEAGEINVLNLNRIDEAVTLPGVKFTAPYDPDGDNKFDSYVHVPMVTFRKPIDDLAEQVSEATEGLVELEAQTAEARDGANQAAAAARTATEGASNVDATLDGMTVTITDRNGISRSQDIGFKISPDHVYSSVEEMIADAGNVLPGQFCMIATTDPTDPDNAQLWTRNDASASSPKPFTFLSDLDQASTSAWADWMDNWKPVIEADHTRAESDHSTASADHSTATGDHSTATSDHETATADHRTYGSDHAISQQQQSTFVQNENTRQTTFDANERQRQSDFDSAQTTRQTTFNAKEQDRQDTFETNEQARQDTFDANEARRQQDFEDGEEARMAAMVVTRCFVDISTMCLMFVQPANDGTEYKVRNGNLNITITYEE